MIYVHIDWASLLTQTIKNSPAVQKTQDWPLGQEDRLEKGTATHSSILAWRFRGEEPGWLHGPWGRKESDTTERLNHWVTNTHTHTHTHTHTLVRFLFHTISYHWDFCFYLNLLIGECHLIFIFYSPYPNTYVKPDYILPSFPYTTLILTGVQFRVFKVWLQTITVSFFFFFQNK